jgi:hypothetical protein
MLPQRKNRTGKSSRGSAPLLVDGYEGRSQIGFGAACRCGSLKGASPRAKTSQYFRHKILQPDGFNSWTGRKLPESVESAFLTYCRRNGTLREVIFEECKGSEKRQIV